MKEKIQDMAERGYVFVHIPKTAGRSILNAMGVKFHCEHKTLSEYSLKLAVCIDRNTEALQECAFELRRFQERKTQ